VKKPPRKRAAAKRKPKAKPKRAAARARVKGPRPAAVAAPLAESAAPPPAPATSLPVPAPPSALGAVPRDTLARYFAEVARYPLLSREEELELATRVHDSNDPEAAQKLVLSNLRLVVKIALE